MNNKSGIGSNLELGMTMGNSMRETGGIVGEVTLECFAADGSLRWTETQKNLITTNGDNYYAQRAAAAINSNGVSQPTLVAGMAVGTGSTAVAKSSTGSFIVTFPTGTTARKNLDSGKPTVSGNVITYVVTFNPTEATNSALAEIALTTDTTDTGGTASTTISRALISPTRNKQSGDTLVATWTHTFLGA